MGTNSLTHTRFCSQNLSAMFIRPATLSDLPAIIALFESTVLAIDRRDYTGEQLAAWASGGAHLSRWQKRVTTQYFLVAASEEIIGFGSVDKIGYLDTLFVHPLHQQQSVAQLLLEALEKWARHQGMARITTEASITAKPFFERNGYEVLQRQEQQIKNEILVNYIMQKNTT